MKPQRARRSLPMFLRVFGAMVLTVIVGSWVFASVFGVYQDRTTAETLAPLWAEAMKQGVPAAAPGSSARATREVRLVVEVLGGSPPAKAVDLTTDARMKALAQALRRAGVDVQEVRLDGAAEPPITWLRVQQGDGVSRWTGLVGGVQPSDFVRRLTLALAALVGVVLVVAALMSRWVAAPVSRLVRQIDGISRGEAPGVPVRGAREIERLGEALTSMASKRNAHDAQLQAMLLGVSHDLRSPLARIRVAADLLDGEASTKLRALIVRNVEQADAIIESFLDFNRAGGEAADEEVDLAHVARIAAELASLPPAQVHAAAPAPVRGNATMLQRLVGNLIDNAHRHGAAPVEVSVDVDVDVDAGSAQAVLRVRDAGPGIVDADRLRKPFERGDAARSTHGAGLGLAIVDRIADRHRGSVEIGAGPGGGTVVTVRMPLR